MEGKIQGKGKKFTVRGQVEYSGSWEDGVPSGAGELYVDGKLKFGGNFVGGKKQGGGKEFDQAGAVRFAGEFLDNNICGFGVAYYPEGGKAYQGEWKDGKKWGKGTSYHNLEVFFYFLVDQEF